MDLSNGELLQKIKEYGFSDIGICEFSRVLPLIKCRGALRVPREAKSVIVGVFAYGWIGNKKIGNKNVAEYAALDDYHLTVGKILEDAAEWLKKEYPEEKFVSFTDNSPIREVEAAYLAGLGKIGKNGLLIHEKYGMRIFIGEIITTLDIADEAQPRGRCTGCGACIKKCPTGAISEDGCSVEKCLSYITQRKGELSEEEKKLMRENNTVWGCDKCIEACPMNKGKELADNGLIVKNIDSELNFENYKELMTRKAYGYRGERTILRNLEIVFGKNNVKNN